VACSHCPCSSHTEAVSAVWILAAPATLLLSSACGRGREGGGKDERTDRPTEEGAEGGREGGGGEEKGRGERNVSERMLLVHTRVQGLGFRVQGLGFRLDASGSYESSKLSPPSNGFQSPLEAISGHCKPSNRFHKQ
jgi:hypothetical protein